MAKAKEKANTKGWRGRLKRVARWAALGLGAFLAGSLLLVLLLRVVPPPVTGIRVQRRVESWSAPGPYTARTQWKPLSEIAPCMGLAVLASEDQTFSDHSGFNWEAIQKAVAHNEKSRRKRGASTISQQTAKNLFLWSSRSWVRKGFEVYFTGLMELCWPKARILETYLNIVEFGDGIYGVEAASQVYFRKPAKRLRPSEAALLAAVLPNPHRFKVTAPSAYIQGRQAWILQQMAFLGGEKVIKELEAK